MISVWANKERERVKVWKEYIKDGRSVGFSAQALSIAIDW